MAASDDHLKTPVFAPPGRPPGSEQELLQWAGNIAGATLGELALAAGVQVPANFKREKGWTGQLIELWLGADAGSKPTQDFMELGIELKTIPISPSGQPLETTYVCYAPLTGIKGLRWEECNVRNKLQKVMWLPVEGSRDIPPAQRRVGTGFVWQPSLQQEKQLKQDWEELVDHIALGDIQSLNATLGTYLQIRPKAADGSALTTAIGKEGKAVQTRPRGFYLRKAFTAEVLAQHFMLG